MTLAESQPRSGVLGVFFASHLEVVLFLVVLHFDCLEDRLLFGREVSHMQLVHRRIVAHVLVFPHFVVRCDLIQCVLLSELSVGSKGFGVHELRSKGLLVLRNEVLLVTLRVIPVTSLEVVPHVPVNGSQLDLAVSSTELVCIGGVELVGRGAHCEVGLAHLASLSLDEQLVALNSSEPGEMSMVRRLPFLACCGEKR